MAMGTAHPRRLRGMLAVGVAALVLAAGCSGGGSSGSSVPAGGTPVKGGTAVFAETPSTTPNYIFPFVASAYISDGNIQDFQHLMYRPLYWFGSSGRPDGEQVAEPGRPAGVQRRQGHDQPEALHVVQRPAGDRDGRHVLAEHGAGRGDWTTARTPGSRPT